MNTHVRLRTVKKNNTKNLLDKREQQQHTKLFVEFLYISIHRVESMLSVPFRFLIRLDLKSQIHHWRMTTVETNQNSVLTLNLWFTVSLTSTSCFTMQIERRKKWNETFIFAHVVNLFALLLASVEFRGYFHIFMIHPRKQKELSLEFHSPFNTRLTFQVKFDVFSRDLRVHFIASLM